MAVIDRVTDIYSRIDANDIEELMNTRDDICISLYMPTERKGAETQQNPIRLKNLIKEAGSRLEERGLTEPEADKLLEPVRDMVGMVDRDEFWQHQSNGLAIFLTSDSLTTLRLPIEFDDLVVIADRFHVKPLLPLLTGNGRFYVLALSMNEVRLLQGTRNTVDEVYLEDVPDSLVEMIAAEDITGWRQARFRAVDYVGGGAQGAGGGEQGVHSVSYMVEEEKKQRILEFFRRIDNGLTDIMEGANAPLVLAGVEYLHPIYEEANSYNNLVDDGVQGNPEEWSNTTLHQKAWEIVGPQFDEELEEARSNFHARKNGDTASSDLDEVVPAAAFGRVDTLFVSVGKQVWGSFDEEANEVIHDDKRTLDNVDLLDRAAFDTLAHGGTVYAVDVDDLPDGGDVAALFRY